MKLKLENCGLTLLTAVMISLIGTQAQSDPLPSWNDSASKKAIVYFVEQVTTKSSPRFVPAPERIATFDNDGTLWAEQPMYFQLFFAMDRVKAIAPLHPEWRTRNRSRRFSRAT